MDPGLPPTTDAATDQAQVAQYLRHLTYNTFDDNEYNRDNPPSTIAIAVSLVAALAMLLIFFQLLSNNALPGTNP
ncbi:hypothetical protein NA56DRAFT_746612 [Hyaloscypha hepaticicola]|uniref:Uncharacterized protein n=1 Tax=Hyaloscypha hepaticicola TaxID=2082293 RepID=A0A2J6QBE4_9HELO|nr:hypothetical protein NA56DRAFT_746612 [Hyaloscypha hepaticicola]